MEKNIPEVLWDWVLDWICKVRSNTHPNLRGLNGMTLEIMLTGEAADISCLAEFGIYDWVWYITPVTAERDDMQTKRLGRYLGPSENVGEAMCGTVLTDRATWVDRTAIIPLTASSYSDCLKNSCRRVRLCISAKNIS